MKKIFFWIMTLGVIAAFVGCAHSGAATQSKPSTDSLFGMPVKTMSPGDIAASNALYDYIRGEVLLLEGQAQKSIPDLTRAISESPNSAYLYLSRATAYAASQKIEAAEEDCLKALELSPDLVPAKLLMARLLSAVGKFSNAIPLLEEVQRKVPEEKEVYPLLAVAYINIQQYAKAIYSMKRLLVLDPDAMVAYYYMGVVYGNYLKQPQLALQMYHKILARDPRNISVYSAIAQLYVDKHNIPKAIETLNEAFANGVDDVTLRLRLSSLYYQNKNYAQAAEILEAVLQKTPNSNKVRYYLGVIYEEAGEFEKARSQYNLITPDSSFFKDAMLRQALHYYRGAQLGAAVGVLQMAIMRAPKVEEFYPLLAVLYEEMDNLPASRQTLERGTKALPKDIALVYALAIVTDRLKDTTGALKLMQRVIELDPTNVGAMNYVGYTYAERGTHLDEAEELLLRAAQMQPQDGYVLDSLGWLYFKRNEYGKALAVLEQAVRVIPNEPVAYKHLGDLYAAMGRTKDAIRCYEQAIALLQVKPSDDVNLEKLQEALSALEKK
jgi:tetratricopeptide (TPR) repeat protein